MTSTPSWRHAPSRSIRKTPARPGSPPAPARARAGSPGRRLLEAHAREGDRAFRIGPLPVVEESTRRLRAADAGGHRWATGRRSGSGPPAGAPPRRSPRHPPGPPGRGARGPPTRRAPVRSVPRATRLRSAGRRGRDPRLPRCSSGAGWWPSRPGGRPAPRRSSGWPAGLLPRRRHSWTKLARSGTIRRSPPPAAARDTGARPPETRWSAHPGGRARPRRDRPARDGPPRPGPLGRPRAGRRGLEGLGGRREAVAVEARVGRAHHDEAVRVAGLGEGAVRPRVRGAAPVEVDVRRHQAMHADVARRTDRSRPARGLEVPRQRRREASRLAVVGAPGQERRPRRRARGRPPAGEPARRRRAALPGRDARRGPRSSIRAGS